MMCGKFVCSMAIGLAVGAVAGMALTVDKRDVRRAAHRAIKSVNGAVDTAMDSIASVVDNFTQMMDK